MSEVDWFDRLMLALRARDVSGRQVGEILPELQTYSHLWPDDDEKTISAVDGAWSGALVEYPLNEGHGEPS